MSLEKDRGVNMSLVLIEALEELEKVKKQRDLYKHELDKTVKWLDNYGSVSAFKVANIIREKMKEE